MTTYRKQREIHYELAPPSRRQPVSVCKVIFAILVALLIIAMIVAVAYVIGYAYLRKSEPIVYVHGDEPPSTTTTRRPVVQHRKQFGLFVVHYSGNVERANDVVSYYNSSLPELMDMNVYANLTTFKISSSMLKRREFTPMNLEVVVDRTFRQSSTSVFVSELFPATAQQIWSMVRGEHRICSKLGNEALCVEICMVVLESFENVPNLTPADTEYVDVDIVVKNLVDSASQATIYKQQSAKRFSVARRKKGCVPMP